MFTGLIQDVGQVEDIDRSGDGARIHISTGLVSEIAEGDSVSVDGICLTATTVNDVGFEVEAMNQTLELTTLSGLEGGARVNLELAMRPSDRLGGHIVQGHGDGVGEVVAAEEDGFARRLRVRLGPELMRYVVAQGSLTLSGVSLTVAELGADWIEVSLIPETLERTNLSDIAVGAAINVECDVIAKYVERQVSPSARKEP
ncbi:MAG TPA: riboflavin synthase [Solirubrobacterales bacterium]